MLVFTYACTRAHASILYKTIDDWSDHEIHRSRRSWCSSIQASASSSLMMSTNFLILGWFDLAPTKEPPLFSHFEVIQLDEP
jgi:hypothetical protein